MVKMAERAHQLPLHVGAQGYRAEMAVSRAQKHQWLNSLRDARFVLDALRHQTSNAPRPNYFTKSTQAGMWQLQPPRRHDSPTTLLRHPSRLVVGVRSQRSPTRQVRLPARQRDRQIYAAGRQAYLPITPRGFQRG
jgi:hypothetical protein